MTLCFWRLFEISKLGQTTAEVQRISRGETIRVIKQLTDDSHASAIMVRTPQTPSNAAKVCHGPPIFRKKGTLISFPAARIHI